MNLNAKQPPILILGCGRSGTSIFGELFAGLEGYTYFSEPPFSEAVANFVDGIAIKVPTESDGYPADTGLSFPLEVLLDAVPSVRIFWIVRHPLDAICSLRIGIGQDWKHHPRPPDWRAWIDKSLVERCAHHWNYINRWGFDAVSDLAHLVKFEDMIRAPSAFAANALEAAGMAPEDHEPSIEQWADRVQDTNNEKFVEAQTSRNHSRPDHTVRVDRWRENLSAAEVRAVISLVSETNERFGYDLESPLAAES